MANWIGTYKGHNMYEVSVEEFRAMSRRERNKVYLVGKYMVLNDNIVGIFDNYVVKPAEQGANIYDTLGVEKPMRITPPRTEPKRKRTVAKIETEGLKVEAEAEEPVSVDTLVE